MSKDKGRVTKSPVWDHFDIDKYDDKKVICRQCKSVLVYDGSTSSMNKHLLAKHTHVHAKRATAERSAE